MFIGHYGVSLAAKRIAPEVSLGSLFIAVQALDVLFGSFLLLGVEHMRIVPGFTRYNPYDLYDVAVSHSLVAALSWSFVAAGAWFVWSRAWRPAFVIGGAVFSHFVLDVPMHTPDLPIASGSGPKLGFGLWNYPALALVAELLLLAAGVLLHTRSLQRVEPRLRWFFVVLLALTIATPILPAPPNAIAFAVQALVAYGALAYYASWAERTPSAHRA